MTTSRLIVALGLLCGKIALAGVFQNGSFENPVIVIGPDFVTVPTGWVKVDPTNNGLFMELDTTFGIPYVPANGHQMYGFGGNGDLTGTLSQTFDTVIGTSYDINFQYIVQQQRNSESEALRVEALNGAVVINSNQFTFNNVTWVSGPTLTFTAQSTSTTLRFTDMTGALLPGVGVSTNWALDAVTVVPSGAIPEPSTFGLVVIGGMVGLAGKRKARAKTGSR